MVHGPGLFGSWATEWSFMTSTVHERSRVAHAIVHNTNGKYCNGMIYRFFPSPPPPSSPFFPLTKLISCFWGTTLPKLCIGEV